MTFIKPKRQEITDHSLMSVSLERVKEQLRIIDDDEDALLIQYIETATNTLETWTGYYMMPATILAYFNYCNYECLIYQLWGRPFYALTQIDTSQELARVILDPSLYTIDLLQWTTNVCIDNTVDIDSSCDTTDGCPDVTDPVIITYECGDRRILSITQISTTTVATPNIATVIVSTAHGLLTNDQVIISDSTATEYDGTFTVTVTSATEFTFNYLGSDPGIVNSGVLTIPVIPKPLQLSVMQMVASMYQNRGDCCDECGEVPCSSQKLASPYKRLILRTNKVRYDCCCW